MAPVIDHYFSVSSAKKKKSPSLRTAVNARVWSVLRPLTVFPDLLLSVLGEKCPIHSTARFSSPRSLLNAQHDVSFITFRETADRSVHKNTISVPLDKHLAPVLTFPDFSFGFSSCSDCSYLLCLERPGQLCLRKQWGWEATAELLKGPPRNAPLSGHGSPPTAPWWRRVGLGARENREGTGRDVTVNQGPPSRKGTVPPRRYPIPICDEPDTRRRRRVP